MAFQSPRSNFDGVRRQAPVKKGRRRTAPLAVALVMLALAACTQVLDRGWDYPRPHHVLATAFESLSERYIEPVDMASASMAGLDHIAAIDPELHFTRHDGMVYLTVAGVEMAAHSEPAGGDPLGWAWLTADMMEEAERHSRPVAQRGREALYEAVFDGVLDGLDRYTRYASADRARQIRAGREGFGGIGVTIGREKGRTIIVTAYPDMPAARAGLLGGDTITHVDATPLAGLSTRQVVDLLRGPVDTSVVVTVTRPGVEAPFRRTVERSHIVPPTVTARNYRGILQIQLTSFNQETARSLRDALEHAGPGLRGVVLDMRGNPGGLLDQAVSVVDLFVSKGRILTTRGRHPDSNQTFESGSHVVAPHVPVAVLINGRSASSAEIVASALADLHRAVVIGAASYGKGTVQTIVRLPNGGELTMTWSHVFRPTGRLLNGSGVVPAVCTSGSSERSAALLAALRSGRISTPMLTGRRPTASLVVEDPRTACPPDPAVRTSDSEIARLIVSNRALYARALGPRTPSVAAR